MGRKIKAKMGKLEIPALRAEDFEISIGSLVTTELDEVSGPTPFPKVEDLRGWDFKLLKRYPMFYAPFTDSCELCTFGKCDLTAGKRGACGIDTSAQQGRIILLACCIGVSCHAAHGRHLLDYYIEKYGRNIPISMGEGVNIEAPVTRLVCGIKPETIGDLEEPMEYVEEQITQLLAAVHTGQEGSALDFESKALHAGMLDLLAMELADIVQIAALGFPKADPEAPLIELGYGVINVEKPVILCVGHNVAPGAEIMDYLETMGQEDNIEVCAICCTAIDMSRYRKTAKVVGSMSHQLKFIRSGVPDVVVVDEQCIRANIPEEATKIGAPVIATTAKVCYGFPDMTEEDPDKIVEGFVSGKLPGAVIFDEEKVGEVAVKTALKLAPLRQKKKTIPSDEEFKEFIDLCIECGRCRRVCPNDLKIPYAMKAGKEGDYEPLAKLFDHCLGCLRCEQECPKDIPIMGLITKADERRTKTLKFKMRAGRGAISDVEIRAVGSAIVLGEIPGVLGVVGCMNYPETEQDVPNLIREFARRRYIITTSGCAAMDTGWQLNEEGQCLYEEYPGDFDASGIVNVGSCVSNSNIAGAAIKIAAIFARRPLKNNFEEIADYILHRVGACGVAWGAMSQKAASIATGFNRIGVPVVIGPHGSKYRRSFMGDKDDDSKWQVFNARTGEKTYIGPAPEHLLYPAESLEEAVPLIAKLCIRANDTTKGRQIKLAHYVDLHKRYIGTFPDDIHYFVRSESDIPKTVMHEIQEHLAKFDWKPTPIPDPTLLERLVRKPKT